MFAGVAAFACLCMLLCRSRLWARVDILYAASRLLASREVTTLGCCLTTARLTWGCNSWMLPRNCSPHVRLQHLAAASRLPPSGETTTLSSSLTTDSITWGNTWLLPRDFPPHVRQHLGAASRLPPSREATTLSSSLTTDSITWGNTWRLPHDWHRLLDCPLFWDGGCALSWSPCPNALFSEASPDTGSRSVELDGFSFYILMDVYDLIDLFYLIYLLGVFIYVYTTKLFCSCVLCTRGGGNGGWQLTYFWCSVWLAVQLSNPLFRGVATLGSR